MDLSAYKALARQQRLYLVVPRDHPQAPGEYMLWYRMVRIVRDDPDHPGHLRVATGGGRAGCHWYTTAPDRLVVADSPSALTKAQADPRTGYRRLAQPAANPFGSR